MRILVVSMLAATLALAGCAKKDESQSAAADTGNAAATSAAPADLGSAPAADSAPTADDSPEAEERARRQALLDYSTMEDRYINDPRGQWASSATASSAFGIAKDKLLDTDGKLHEVWSGLDDTQKDRRGYKTIDAVQLVEAG
mgnify:FL=1